MKFAIQRCCTTSELLWQYESSTDALFKKLGVEIVDIKGFNCCGYPLRNIDSRAYVLASSKNLALAQKYGFDVLTICNCCYGSLKKAKYLVENDDSIRTEINEILSKEGIKLSPPYINVKHIIEFLYYDIGIEVLSKKIKKSFQGLNIAVHNGCHLLRPRKIIGFDNPLNPEIFEKLVKITGAQIVGWSMKLECCGSSVMGIDGSLGAELTKKKIVNAKSSGADLICVACPYCHLQFDRIQKSIIKENGRYTLPAILYTQLLGLCLDIDERELGLNNNFIDITSIKDLLLPAASPFML